MNHPIWIAIDGPAGSGKSSVASEIIKILPNFIHINTGAMYRALAYFLNQKNINITNEDEIKPILKEIEISFNSNNDVIVNFNNQKINVTQYIYNEKIAKITAQISIFASVRQKLVSDQQKIASNQNIVMDGRDIGTVVLPDAQLKIYLDASIKKRAERRIKQLLETGQKVDINEIENEIKVRDFNDKNRPIGALKIADDAILIDTDNLTINECSNKIIELLNQKLEQFN